MFRVNVNQENVRRLNSLAQMQQEYPHIWRDLIRWGENYGVHFNLAFPVDPELIWVGENYGIEQGMTPHIPRELFIGYNPRFSSFEMGYRKSNLFPYLRVILKFCIYSKFYYGWLAIKEVEFYIQ